MEDRVVVLGQPIRPLLVVVPLELFITAVLFDLAGAATGVPLFAQVGYWTLALGLITAAVAGVAVLVDLQATPSGAQRRIALARWAVSSAGALAFGLVWFARLSDEGRLTGGLLALELIALAVGIGGALLAGWLAQRPGVVAATRAHAEAMAQRLTGHHTPTRRPA